MKMKLLRVAEVSAGVMIPKKAKKVRPPDDECHQKAAVPPRTLVESHGPEFSASEIFHKVRKDGFSLQIRNFEVRYPAMMRTMS